MIRTLAQLRPKADLRSLLRTGGFVARLPRHRLMPDFGYWAWPEVQIGPYHEVRRRIAAIDDGETGYAHSPSYDPRQT
jgi:hypothetical protein